MEEVSDELRVLRIEVLRQAREVIHTISDDDLYALLLQRPVETFQNQVLLKHITDLREVASLSAECLFGNLIKKICTSRRHFSSVQLKFS